MEKLIFINSRGEQIEIGNKAPYILKNLGGASGLDIDVQMDKSPYQQGKTYIDAMANERLLSINFVILSKTEEEKFNLRQNINRVLNPLLGEGTLLYSFDGGEKEIKVAIKTMPLYKDESPEEPDGQLETIVHFIAANPFWMDRHTESEEMKDWVDGFRFTLRLPMTFCKRAFKRNFENKGDIETPIVATFYGQCVNPIIKNLSTGEFVKVNRELVPGQKLIISTEFGNKSVEIENSDGSRINAFGWIDLESTFFNLIPGINLIEYGADSGREDTRVLIEWRNKYVGV